MTKEELLVIKNWSVFIKQQQILDNITLGFQENTVTSILGPSGCGKTTLIRCLNRLNELVVTLSTKGEILLKNQSIHTTDPVELRQKIGMVFQRPNPFPHLNIFNNVLAGYLLNGIKKCKEEKEKIVQESLEMAGLWNEVKDDLFRKGTFLSGGQQQRLCIARALAMKPDILLLDEPTSALDPIATTKIENLLNNLKNNVTVILVTHNIAQASRVSDYTAFMYLGKLIECNRTDIMFTNPKERLTEEYLTRKVG